jgi:hypothetical protein
MVALRGVGDVDTFALHICIDNDAFQPYPHSELARILRQAANQLQNGEDGSEAVLSDSNGNTVGSWQIVRGKP